MNDINREYLIGQYAVDLKHLAEQLEEHEAIRPVDAGLLRAIARVIVEDATANLRHRPPPPGKPV